jgi:hypothetical protein
MLTMLAPIYDFNSQSSCTGIVLFFGLARTLIAVEASSRARLGTLLLVALLAAGLSSLRVHFLAGAALLAMYWLASGWSGVRSLPALNGRAAILLCASLAFFAPWMAALWRSSGTPLFPLFAGTSANGYDSFAVDDASFAALVLAFVTSMNGLFLALPVFALSRPAPERQVLINSFVTAVLLTLLFAWRIPASGVWDLGRYMWPMVAVPVLLSVIVMVHVAQSRGVGLPAVIALIAGTFVMAGSRLQHDFGQLARALNSDTTAESARLAEPQRRLQALMPENETLLVATDRPYLIDYRRDRTWNVDLPGTASPSPGMPFFRGPEALRDYLLTQGVHYVLFVDGRQAHPCLFDRARYASPKMRDAPPLWRLQARYILDFLDNMERLTTSQTVLGSDSDHVLLRLDAR